MCLSHRFTGQGFGALDGGAMPFAEPGVAPHYGPSRAVRLVHIEIRLDLWPEQQRFEGEATYHLEALPSFQGRFALDCDDVTVLEVAADGGAIDWRMADGAIEIRAADVPDTVTVRWRGERPTRGLFFTGPETWAPERQPMAWTQCQDEDAHFVFPCHDHPGQKHTWAIHLTGPEGYTLLSNGQALQSGVADGRCWAQFVQEDPMPAYLFTAVCARLSCVEAEWRGRPVRYWVPEGRDEAVVRAMGKTPLMLEHFSERTGVDYPWPRYDQVVVDDFIFGGMENVACTTMTDLLLVDANAALDWDPDDLVAHELAHQWFGDLVTCQDWSQGWLNESWATLMEAVWREHDRDAADAMWYRHQTSSDYFAEHHGRYSRPIVSYRFREPIDVFDRHLYNKGSCVLWTLRALLGPDAFWTGVKHYLDANRHDTVHTRLFQRSMERATGVNLDRFFEQWVHSPGHPILDVQMSEADGLVSVQVTQKQTGEGVPEAFAFGLDVDLVSDDGQRTRRTLTITEREQVVVLAAGDGFCGVRVDPDLSVLAEITLRAPRPWLEALLTDESPVLAVRAAQALLKMDGNAPVQAVVRALGAHPFHGVRSAIAGALAKRGGERVMEDLVDALEAEADPRVQKALYAALGNFREATDSLLERADGNFDTVQSHGAFLEALGRTRDPRCLPILTQALGTDSWAFWVTRKALSGLGHSLLPEAVDALMPYARGDQPGRVRASAATALGTLGDRLVGSRDAIVERLCEMLVEPGFNAQLAAMHALAKIRDPKALAPLSMAHRTAPDGRTRRTAYEAMVRIRESRNAAGATQQLRRDLEALKNENASLKGRLDRLESTASADR